VPYARDLPPVILPNPPPLLSSLA